MKLFSKIVGLATFLATLSSAFAGDLPFLIEQWNAKALKIVARNADGTFISTATLELESWSDGDNKSEWIARYADGTFATGYKGHLEKFKVSYDNVERTRLVVRNKYGHFVTWADVDHMLTAKWELWKDGYWRYVIRLNGKFVNHAKARFETWSNYHKPVLVARDSSDDENNGKILTWIPPEMDSWGNVHYRNPQTGTFMNGEGIE